MFWATCVNFLSVTGYADYDWIIQPWARGNPPQQQYELFVAIKPDRVSLLVGSVGKQADAGFYFLFFHGLFCFRTKDLQLYFLSDRLTALSWEFTCKITLFMNNSTWILDVCCVSTHLTISIMLVSPGSICNNIHKWIYITCHLYVGYYS